MRSVRRLFAAAALLAGLGLAAAVGPAGRSQAQEKEKAKGEDVAQAVRDVATAYDLIDFGRRTQDPLSIIAGVKMLMNLQEPSGGEVKVEGAGSEEALKKKEVLQKILDEAKEMPTAAAKKTYKDLLKETIAEVKAMEFRATDKGGTSWQGMVNPNTPVTLTRKFKAKEIATICAIKVFSVGAPIDVRVQDSAGHEIKHDTGNSTRFDWQPAKDEEFKIVVQNKHTAAVLVKVTTN